MQGPKFSVALFSMVMVIFAVLFWRLPPVFAQNTSLTERECALTEGAEVIWDLRVYQWVCCIPRGEYLEDCVPISDKAPLPKTSTKPLPQKGTKVIINSKKPQVQND
jgi:hypothetical protein